MLADSCSKVRLCLKLYIEFLKLHDVSEAERKGCLVDISLHPVTLRWPICPFKMATICMEKGARPEEQLFKE